MALLSVVAIVLRFAILIYQFVLWGRFVIDWVRVLSPGFRPKGAVLVLFEGVYTLTDPPIRMFRRILPPIRLGSIAIDLGWVLTFVCCIIARGLLGLLIV